MYDPVTDRVDGLACQLLKGDRKSTRLNSSHGYISYAVFCLKKKKNDIYQLGMIGTSKAPERGSTTSRIESPTTGQCTGMNHDVKAYALTVDMSTERCNPTDL